MTQYLIAIVHVSGDFKKYNIQKGSRALISFLTFVEKKFPLADKVNIYNKNTREFIRQIDMPTWKILCLQS